MFVRLILINTLLLISHYQEKLTSIIPRYIIFISIFQIFNPVFLIYSAGDKSTSQFEYVNFHRILGASMYILYYFFSPNIYVYIYTQNHVTPT
jgi:hypothetical protein